MVAVKINTGVGLCSCKSQPPLFQEELLMIKATSKVGSFDGPHCAFKLICSDDM